MVNESEEDSGGCFGTWPPRRVRNPKRPSCHVLRRHFIGSQFRATSPPQDDRRLTTKKGTHDSHHPRMVTFPMLSRRK